MNFLRDGNLICHYQDFPEVFDSLQKTIKERGVTKENNIAPQVVFEILSPGNTKKEMSKKLLFYDCYGVEEYYIYDPDKNELSVFF